mgnify:FL=1
MVITADHSKIELEFLVLEIAISGASVLQALTEIGFGGIADLVLLVILSDGLII